MSSGGCFHCHQPGHWAKNCPLKTPTKITTVTASPPPIIQCRCKNGVCNVFTSKTAKNPDRKFYKCSAVPSCGFFKWCDEMSIKSDSITSQSHPTCPCGSGPCKRVTVIDGPNANRSYFVCCIKKGFGACGFFQWENETKISSGYDCSPCSTLIGFPDFDEAEADDDKLVLESDLSSGGANFKWRSRGMVSRFVEKEEGNRFGDGIAKILQMDDVSVGTESINNGENQASSSLKDLNEKYNLEKLHFESLLVKHAIALTAFAGSIKQIESARVKADSLRKELLEAENEKIIKEKESLELAESFRKVSEEMAKSQKTMADTAGEIVRTKRVYKQMEFAGPQEDEAEDEVVYFECLNNM